MVNSRKLEMGIRQLTRLQTHYFRGRQPITCEDVGTIFKPFTQSLFEEADVGTLKALESRSQAACTEDVKHD